MKYKNIVWDWNGTLFDDVDVCIESMNIVLKENNLSQINSKEKYKEIFCFPVKEYYKKLLSTTSAIIVDDIAEILNRM